MEVHPPHEPVHSWRDALIHIGLMTIGLFIALMLEGLVEYLHHKELVHQARENIRRELRDNHQAALKDEVFLQQSADKIKAGLATLRYMQAHPDAKGQSIGFTVQFTDLNDAAWRTARDSGALGYMPLDEVQQYAGVYGLQQAVTQQTTTLLTHQAEALAPIISENEKFSNMSAQEFADMRRVAATNYTDVLVLNQLLHGLDQGYVDTLKQGK